MPAKFFHKVYSFRHLFDYLEWNSYIAIKQISLDAVPLEHSSFTSKRDNCYFKTGHLYEKQSFRVLVSKRGIHHFNKTGLLFKKLWMFFLLQIRVRVIPKQGSFVLQTGTRVLQNRAGITKRGRYYEMGCKKLPSQSQNVNFSCARQKLAIKCFDAGILWIK